MLFWQNIRFFYRPMDSKILLPIPWHNKSAFYCYAIKLFTGFLDDKTQLNNWVGAQSSVCCDWYQCIHCYWFWNMTFQKISMKNNIDNTLFTPNNRGFWGIDNGIGLAHIPKTSKISFWIEKSVMWRLKQRFIDVFLPCVSGIAFKIVLQNGNSIQFSQSQLK